MSFSERMVRPVPGMAPLRGERGHPLGHLGPAQFLEGRDHVLRDMGRNAQENMHPSKSTAASTHVSLTCSQYTSWPPGNHASANSSTSPAAATWWKDSSMRL